MEMVFLIGILVVGLAIAYGVHQSRSRQREKGIELPEEKVDRKKPSSSTTSVMFIYEEPSDVIGR